MMNTNRQHVNETIRRLTKPRNNLMTQSVHISSASSNGIPISRSSHQIRMSTPPTSATIRRVNQILHLFFYI